jgi:hypothetical protein
MAGAARAQQTDRIRQVGILMPFPESDPESRHRVCVRNRQAQKNESYLRQPSHCSPQGRAKSILAVPRSAAPWAYGPRPCRFWGGRWQRAAAP